MEEVIMNTVYKKIYVDVGAEGGGWCVGNWSKDTSIDLIYAFEPNKGTFVSLKRNACNYKNIFVYEEAITNIDGTLIFYENTERDTSSLLPFDEDGVKKWCQTVNHNVVKTKATYNVKCTRLKTFMDRVGIDHIDFLKIDTQGQDLEVIKSLDDYIKRVKKIYLEVQVSGYELYKNQSKKQDILDYMRGYNFAVEKVDVQCCGLEENILFNNIGQV
jgi:FkbM family methyltransferase